MKISLKWSTLVPVALLAACVGLDPTFTTGTSQDAVRAKMGAPRSVNATRDGMIWEYPEGPAGLRTFLARFDAQGSLVSYEQVLNDEHFSRVETGKSTAREVREILGPPWRTMEFPRLKQTAWDYHIQDAWGYDVEYSILIGDAGVVVGRVHRRLNDGRDGGMH